MKKEQLFENMHLAPAGFIELDEYLTRPGGPFHADHLAGFQLTSHDGGQWQFTSFEDFIVEYEPMLFASYDRGGPDFRVIILNVDGPRRFYSKVTVFAPDSQTIDDIFNIIEKYREHSIFFPPDPKKEITPRKPSPVKKTKTFKHMQLVREGLQELDQYLTCQGAIFGDPHSSLFEIVYPDGTRRVFDKSPAFLPEYFPLFRSHYQRSRPGFEVNIVNFHDFHDLYSTVSVLAQNRRTIHYIFNIIETYYTQSILFSEDPQKSAENLYEYVKRAARAGSCRLTKTSEPYLADPTTG